MAANANPFDVDAIEQSVNSSAVRVSTIWVSFLIFGLYLVITVFGTNHRQLLLAEPIKLPVADVNLPLVGFFFVAPTLFVLFHAYMLVQVLLLARTAAAYNEAVEHVFPVASDRARVRQRLANTLFAQLFAGAPRERTGLLGFILRSMAWVTLAFAPVLVLLAFEVVFIAYQHVGVTFVHRLLIIIDLAAVLLLWPTALDPQREVSWRAIVQHPLGVVTAFGLVGLSFLLTFPGDLGEGPNCVGGYRLRIPLLLNSEILVDKDKRIAIESVAKDRDQKAWQSERTRNFQNRSLNCGNFRGADLRRVDFSGAKLRRADFSGADLRGAVFTKAELQEAYFFNARLQEASFREAHLQGAILSGADLSGADLVAAPLQGMSLVGVRLQGADLSRAQLRGADLREALLQGANLSGAELQGATLGAPDFPRTSRPRDIFGYEEPDRGSAQLQGANLRGARLQGARLFKAQLQGADLNGANLDGVDLSEAGLQGARLERSSLQFTDIRQAYLWRGTRTECDRAQVVKSQFDALDVDGFIEEIGKTVSEMPEATKIKQLLRDRLKGDPKDDRSNERIWQACELKALNRDEWEKRHADYLARLVCSAGSEQEILSVDGDTSVTNAKAKYLMEGIARHWMRICYKDALQSGSSQSYDTGRQADTRWQYWTSRHAQAIARALLGLEGKSCGGAKVLQVYDLQYRTKLDTGDC